MDNALTTENIGNFIAEIESLQTEADIKEFFKKLNTLKTLLDAADEFKKQACKYAKLEAYALVRIARMGLADQIAGKGGRDRRETANWLAGLTDDEIDEKINICGEHGVTITYLYMHSTDRLNVEVENALLEVQNISDDAVDELNEIGFVDVSGYRDMIAKVCKPYVSIKPDIVSNEFDGLRKKLRNNGGAGAHGTYLYVKPENALYEQAKGIVEERIKSVFNDLLSLCDIANKSHYYMTESEFKRLMPYNDSVTDMVNNIVNSIGNALKSNGIVKGVDGEPLVVNWENYSCSCGYGGDISLDDKRGFCDLWDENVSIDDINKRFYFSLKQAAKTYYVSGVSYKDMYDAVANSRLGLTDVDKHSREWVMFKYMTCIDERR